MVPPDFDLRNRRELNQMKISENAKNFFQRALKEAKESFKLLEMDFDMDTTPEGHLMVKLDNVGATVKLPGASLLVTAAHAGNLGLVEPENG